MPVITAETAREMAARSQEARRKRKQAGVIQPATILTMPQITDSVAETANREFAREYQEHLTRLRAQLADTVDPQKIDRLCAAIARLEDVYCRYAGIPNPGSRKPAADKPARQRPAMVEPS